MEGDLLRARLGRSCLHQVQQTPAWPDGLLLGGDTKLAQTRYVRPIEPGASAGSVHRLEHGLDAAERVPASQWVKARTIGSGKYAYSFSEARCPSPDEGLQTASIMRSRPVLPTPAES
jgi:hypothetical protein